MRHVKYNLLKSLEKGEKKPLRDLRFTKIERELKLLHHDDSTKMDELIACTYQIWLNNKKELCQSETKRG